MRNMKRMADRYFNKIDYEAIFLDAPVEKDRKNALIRKSGQEEEEFSKTTDAEAKIRENFTATYWG